MKERESVPAPPYRLDSEETRVALDPAMNCPACTRPVAMARPTCVYCGAVLPEETLEEASFAAQRVLRSKTLLDLENAARGAEPARPPRRYLVIDTTSVSAEALALGCSISEWETRQWRAASRYRLLRISDGSQDGPLESQLRESGVTPLAIPEDVVARARRPMTVETLDLSATPVLRAHLVEEPDEAVVPKDVREEDIVLMVSGSIKREKVREAVASRLRADGRLDDGYLVHLHLKGEARPWEIDPGRTGYQGAGPTSAYMRTLELVRRLAASISHDEGFKNVVPALSPGVDPLTDLSAMRDSRPRSKESKTVILDNVAQFREYSAWRAAVERTRQ